MSRLRFLLLLFTCLVAATLVAGCDSAPDAPDAPDALRIERVGVSTLRPEPDSAVSVTWRYDAPSGIEYASIFCGGQRQGGYRDAAPNPVKAECTFSDFGPHQILLRLDGWGGEVARDSVLVRVRRPSPPSSER